MNTRNKLRIASLIMLVIAVIFVFIAISAPTLGQVIYIGGFEFGPDLWRVCYKAYAVIMFALLAASFFLKKEHHTDL